MKVILELSEQLKNIAKNEKEKKWKKIVIYI
jgi:hypothetical protein